MIDLDRWQAIAEGKPEDDQVVRIHAADLLALIAEVRAGYAADPAQRGSKYQPGCCPRCGNRQGYQ